MLIQRDYNRTHTPRARAKDAVNPMQKTAEGLGLFLNRLSETVRASQNADSGDVVDSDIERHAKNPTRGFKFPSQNGAAEIGLNLSASQSETLAMLKDARNLAADASNNVMTMAERLDSQERLQAIMLNISAKRIEILESILSGIAESEDPLFSLITPMLAKEAYTAIDDMILKILDTQTDADGANTSYTGHEAALNASEQLRDFLINEGPAKAFSRFREINRSNVLGLLQ